MCVSLLARFQTGVSFGRLFWPDLAYGPQFSGGLRQLLRMLSVFQRVQEHENAVATYAALPRHDPALDRTSIEWLYSSSFLIVCVCVANDF